MAQINKPSDYFNTVTWSGDNTSPRTITGVGFQPDWVWLKNRTGGTRDHYLSDVVRGANKSLNSNTTDAEVTGESNGYTSAFASDGFTLVNGGNSVGEVNDSTRTYVAWNWKAGGTASSNTDGSITSSVSANTTSGFSIVSYTGTGANATVGHGLGVAPKMIIIKGRSSSFDWTVGNDNLGWNKYLMLHSTNAEATDTTVFNNTAPTSSVFSLGTNVQQNASSATYIAYCFAEKKGFSKFGSFNGNASADGTFVYTGFKPAFVITKLSSGIGSWFLHDNKRNGYNGGNNYVYPNASDAELTTQLLDITSNGFKMRFAGGANSSGTSIYMAFAENPLVGTNNIPATAR